MMQISLLWIDKNTYMPLSLTGFKYDRLTVGTLTVTGRG